jgi:hypothetical protein
MIRVTAMKPNIPLTYRCPRSVSVPSSFRSTHVSHMANRAHGIMKMDIPSMSTKIAMSVPRVFHHAGDSVKIITHQVNHHTHSVSGVTIPLLTPV